MKKETIENLAYFAGRLLKPLAVLWMPIAVSQQIRREITDPDKIDEPLRLGKRIRKHADSFMGCKVHTLPDYFAHKAMAYNERRTQNHDDVIQVQPYVQPEIDKKQIGDIVAKLENAPMIHVSCFEETEHQVAVPAVCEFGDYVIQFSPAGTEWCGGMRGNGYIVKKMPNGTRQQICTISPNLSDHLAMIAKNKTK